MKRDPKTPEEWQTAVDSASALRLIADCRMYGLIDGGPSIDVARCDEIVERGLASPATSDGGHCRQGTGADMIRAVVDDGS
jgi:hypothetical protein